MTIREKIKEISLASAGDLSAKDVRVGLRYTAVCLDSGQAGVAFTFHKNSKEGYRVHEGLRPFAGRRASELISMLDSRDPVESAVALATSNALSNTMKEGHLKGNILGHLDLRPDHRVGMVGHFAPLVPLLRKKVSSLLIFEQIEQPQDDLLPERDAYGLLPRCQVALISSSSILNDTIDALLDACRSCGQVVMLGATTPLIPEAFGGTPVTYLSGVVITEPLEIMRIVSEGGGTRLFKKHVKKVNLPLK